MFYVRGFFPSLVAIWAHGVVGPFPPWWEGFICTRRSPPRGLFPWIFPPQQPNEALLLAPWESHFLTSVKDLSVSEAVTPSVDSSTQTEVKGALRRVEMKSKESAYQAWLGYYNSNKTIGGNKSRLVTLGEEFSRSMGLAAPPAIPKLILRKMGLSKVPGFRST